MPHWMLRTQVALSLLLLLVLTLGPGQLGGSHSLQNKAAPLSDGGVKSNQTPPFATSGGAHGPSSDQYGGSLGLPIDNSSGYFRTAQIDGRWWLVTPEGHAFWSMGVNSISPSVGSGATDSYAYYNAKQYPDLGAWYNLASQRLISWGFNTIGSWSDPALDGRGLVSTRLLDLTAGQMPRASSGFPDVFDPAFPPAVQQAVKANISDAAIHNPWLLGYFLDNELWWYHNGFYVAQPHNTVVENYIALPASAAGKRAWVNLLTSRYASIGALNAAWGSGYTSFNGNEATSLLNTTSITNPAADDNKDAFLRQIADRYYSVTSSSVRARDPNHLILGDRHLPPPQFRAVVEAAQPYIDVQSVNVYNRNFNYAAPDLTTVDQAGVWGNKPVLITEFTARAADSGQPNNFGSPGPILPTQDSRADAYRTFINELVKRPYVVGVHWFDYADDPAVGLRSDQSNNWGLVDATDRPYNSLVLRMADYNQHVYEQRVGQTVGAVPTPYYPRAFGKVFSSDPTFSWEGVSGVTTYTLQLSRRPDFADSRTYVATGTWLQLPDPLDTGRWYWRIRAWSDRPDGLAYTAAQPFYVYSVNTVATISDFESDADLASWRSDPSGAVSILGVGAGATSGTQAAQFGYTGQSNYDTLWAGAYKQPEGADFQPRDWSQYDFLALDVTNPSLAFPYPLVHSAIYNDDSSVAADWQAQVYPGNEHFAYQINTATKIDLTQIGHYLFGYRQAEAGRVLYVDNIRLLRVDHDSVAQPPINALAADSQRGSAVELDWVGYQPATTTVGYRIYASDASFDSVDGMKPVAQLDATAMHTRVRLAVSQTSGKALALTDGANYYFAVIPVDAWGNSGPLGPLTQAIPTSPF